MSHQDIDINIGIGIGIGTKLNRTLEERGLEQKLPSELQAKGDYPIVKETKPQGLKLYKSQWHL